MPNFLNRLGEAFSSPEQLQMLKSREDAARKAEEIRAAKAASEASMRDVSFGGQNFRVPEDKAAEYAFEREKSKFGKNAMPPGMKLGVDQRWNPETQSVEILPGSKTFLGQKEKYATDAKGLESARALSKNTGSKIDKILSPDNKDAFNSQFGMSTLLGSRFMPGKSQNIKAELSSLESDLSKMGKDLMSSGGAIGTMSVQEWPIVQGMIARITPSMTEEAAREKIQEVKDYVAGFIQRAEKAHQNEWGGSQFEQAAPTRQGGGKRYQIISVE